MRAAPTISASTATVVAIDESPPVADWRSDLLPVARTAVDAAVSSSWSRRVTRSQHLFDVWCVRRRVSASLASAPSALIINYLCDAFGGATPAAASAARPLLTARRLAGGPTADLMLKRFLRAASASRPPSRRFVSPPIITPHRIVQLLPRGDSFFDRRLRALVLLRIVSMMRGGEPAAISRSSIRRTRNLLDRPIVVFHYRSKSSNAAGVARDSNHVEYLSPSAVPSSSTPSVARLFCPASQFYDLFCVVDRLCRFRRDAPDFVFHDALFTDAAGFPLKPSTCSSLVTRFLRSLPFPGVERLSSHDLRGIVQSFLDMAGVDVRHVMLRAGWVAPGDNATRIHHYTRYRQVPENFADLLCFPLPGT